MFLAVFSYALSFKRTAQSCLAPWICPCPTEDRPEMQSITGHLFCSNIAPNHCKMAPDAKNWPCQPARQKLNFTRPGVKTIAAHQSKKVIYAALAGNTLIAICKFIAAGLTGSSAMLSEAIHSVVDSGNQILLLYGIKRAKQQPDEKHPFGYGMELYFWTFVVAIMIFAIGAGLSFYEGIKHVLNPEPMGDPTVNYVILILSMVFEGAAWMVAYKAFNKERGNAPFFQAIRHSKDPTIFTVLFEDTAAMIGLMIALMGVAGSHIFGIHELDGLASIGIGIVLAGVAILLATESKGLLIGEGADPLIVGDIRAMFAADKRISKTNEILTMHLGPNEILLNASFDFIDGLPAEVVEASISEFERKIKERFPAIRRIFIEAQGWRAHAADANGAQTES